MSSLRNLIFGLISFFVISIAYADFGCRFIVGQSNPLSLDGADKKISIRFTCREDMVLSSAAVFCASAVNPPAYFASIQTDRRGKPSSVSLKSSKCFVPKPGAWMVVPLDGVGMQKGKIYHIVLEYDPGQGGGHPVGQIGSGHYASFLSTSPLNKFHVYDEAPDPAANVLICQRGRWKPMNQQPLFAVYGRGFSSYQGNPYDVSGGLPIHGNGTPDNPVDDVLQGQVVHASCDLLPTGFSIRIKKIGRPTAPLAYRVYSHDYLKGKTAEIYRGTALLPQNAPADWKWMTFDVPSHFPLKPVCYYIGFQTDSGGPQGDSCKDCYTVSYAGSSGGLAATMDLTFGAGAHFTRATASHDGGKNWNDDYTRDLNFVVIAEPCPILQGASPSPEPATPAAGGAIHNHK
jgi:hypothetical protein